jgi:dTDP-4-dehydrorhamnose 3,5-epimerase-like enzyme
MNELEASFAKGKIFNDDRGTLSAFEIPKDFEAKRLYFVSNWKSGFIRAWHGHFKESKLITVIQGAGMVAAVPLSEPLNPDKNVKITRQVITPGDGFFFVPGAHANGLMSLTSDCKFLIISSSSLEESVNDDFRYPFDYWQAWNIDQR